MSQQVFRNTLRMLTNHNILSKRVLMFYETLDVVQLLEVFITDPSHLLVWIAALDIQKWIVIFLIIAL